MGTNYFIANATHQRLTKWKMVTFSWIGDKVNKVYNTHNENDQILVGTYSL